MFYNKVCSKDINIFMKKWNVNGNKEKKLLKLYQKKMILI